MEASQGRKDKVVNGIVVLNSGCDGCRCTVLRHRSNVCKITHCSETSRQAKHSGASSTRVCFTGSLSFPCFGGVKWGTSSTVLPRGLQSGRVVSVFPRGSVAALAAEAAVEREQPDAMNQCIPQTLRLHFLPTQCCPLFRLFCPVLVPRLVLPLLFLIDGYAPGTSSLGFKRFGLGQN